MKANVRKSILKDNLTDMQANIELERQRKQAFGNNGILCKCQKCGGIGYAQDETCLDRKGVLIGMRCPCGGKIKRMVGGKS